MATVSKTKPFRVVVPRVSSRLVVAQSNRDRRGEGVLAQALAAAEKRRSWSGLADGWSRCYTEQCSRWSKTRQGGLLRLVRAEERGS
ncbi:hypothetical protein TgHK011_004201 [Trichoderma gracile]|nr:hypothetical protein TgHK011_004201 [Trichoderma gracile]